MNELFMQERIDFLEGIRRRWWNDPDYRKSLNYRELIANACDTGKAAADKYPLSDGWIKPEEYAGSREYANRQFECLLDASAPTKVNDLIARAARAFGAGWRLRQTDIAEDKLSSQVPGISVIQDTL